MMKSPLMKMLVNVSLWLLAIVALNLGLVPVLGYNLLEAILQKIGLGSLFMPIHYLVGIAGLVALYALLTWKNCHCGE